MKLLKFSYENFKQDFCSLLPLVRKYVAYALKNVPLILYHLEVEIMFRALYDTLYFDTDAKFAFLGAFSPF